MKKLLFTLVLSVGAVACLMPLPAVATLPQVQLAVVGEETAVWDSADYQGKPVMMVFMGSWCPWCKKTMPAVMEVAEEFGDQVEIVAVFMDNEASPVQAALKEHQFTVKSLYNGGELAETVSVQGLPHTVLFDKKHRAIKHWEGFSPDRASDYRQALKKVSK